MFDIAHHQIRPVHHAPIPDLNCCLWMASSGLVTDLDPVVILVKGICIIGILGFRVRKHPDEFAIVISEVPFCPSDSRCYNLVKLAIPSDQELHIFFFCDELPYQLSDLFFSFKEAVNLTVAEERHGIDKVTDLIAERTARRHQIETYLQELRSREPLTEFRETNWLAMVDYITVHSKDDIRVTFKDGTEIKA